MSTSCVRRARHSHVLCALLAVLATLFTSGCSAFDRIVIGPDPEVPLAAPTDYEHVSLGLAAEGPPAVRYAPVGVRMIEDGLGVDILIESRELDAMQLACDMSDIGTFGYGASPVRWLRIREVGGGELLLDTGSPGSRKDNNMWTSVSFAMHWSIDAGSRNGVQRTLTTVLFHKPPTVSPAAVEVAIMQGPHKLLSEMAYVQEHAFIPVERKHYLATLAAAATAPDAAAWGAWKRVVVQSVKPWNRRRR